MLPLELSDLVISPAMVAVGLNAYRPHLPSRVIGAQSDVDRVLHHNAECYAQSLAAPGCSARSAISLTTCSRRSPAARLSPCTRHKSFDDPAIGALRRRLEATELR